jgi:hypothetical protein
MQRKPLSSNAPARSRRPILAFARNLRGLLKDRSVAERALLTFLAQAYKYKEISDYSVGRGAGVTDQEAKDAIDAAARFIARVTALLTAPRTEPMKRVEVNGPRSWSGGGRSSLVHAARSRVSEGRMGNATPPPWRSIAHHRDAIGVLAVNSGACEHSSAPSRLRRSPGRSPRA